jgi:metal-sulfur cluster biosynthetic enzyme
MTPHPDDFRQAAARLDQDPDDPPQSAPDVTPVTDATGASAEIDGDLVWEALSTVIDPEIGLDIVTIGLVYEVELIENAVRVSFTLTTPGCPMERIITDGILNAVAAVPSVEHVLPNLVWEPRWHPGMMKEESW